MPTLTDADISKLDSQKTLTDADISAHDSQQAGPGISAQPEAKGIGDKLARWADNVSADIKYGTDVTGVGSVLKKLGAHGVYSGEAQKVGDFMASLPLGLLRAIKGEGEVVGGKVGQGSADFGGGWIQAAEFPANMASPDVGEAGIKGAVTTGEKLASLVPSTKRAAQKFSEVMSAAGDIPINPNGPGETALRIRELANSGGQMPKVVKDFLKRVTDPDKGPVTYAEARDFYSNATRVSFDEMSRLTPVMKKSLGDFTSTLGGAISDAADQAGKLAEYQQAMKQYHRAMQLKAFGSDIKDLVVRSAAKAPAQVGAGAVGGYAVKKLLE